MSKPMTKALHTVRVVAAIAAMVRADSRTIYRDEAAVLAEVLRILGNAAPTDAALLTACLAACKA